MVFPGLHFGKMRCVYRIGFLLLFGQASFLSDTTLADQLLNETHVKRLECNDRFSDRLNASDVVHPPWKSCLKVRVQFYIN